MAETEPPPTWKQATGTLCLLIALPAGFFGVLSLLGCVWSIIQINKGRDLGDAFGLGLMFAICLLAVAIPLGISGWELLKAPPAERSKKQKP